MSGSTRAALWSSPKCPFAIRTSPELLEQLNLAVTESFLAFRRGGLEIGGLLFGKRSGNQIELLAHRPIFCEHAQGPGFALSPADHCKLARQLSEWQLDPHLSGARVVGWYRSRTRGLLTPAAEDLTFHEQYFPDAFQFLLVLRPALGSATRVNVFFRSVEGVLDPDSGFEEIELERIVAPRPEDHDLPEPARALADGAIRGETRRNTVPVLPPPLRARNPAEPSHRLHTVLTWVLFLVMAAGMLAGALWWPRDQRLGLRVTERNGQLTIEWNRAAPLLEEARGGRLEVREGESAMTALFQPAELRNGKVVYLPRGDRVQVRLSVESALGRRIEEQTSFVPAPVRP